MSEEIDRRPLTPEQLLPARHFAASFAGEHVAGTEFVIGALFVAWGVSTNDILLGLIVGNILAVLTWALICAPIAVDTRLTLYAYLGKIAGPGTIYIYSLVNGILFCILAGTMITVSASAVRIPFDIAPQTQWYPTDLSFIAVALGVGAVVVVVAVKGFREVSQFAQVCAPWMVLMFIVGAMAMLPVLVNSDTDANFITVFQTAADTHIWRGDGEHIGLWHVASFAWICNLAMHGGLSDMTLLRFAKRASYGYFSAFGMFIGHYLAWICAGIMGAGTALLLKTTISQLDAGEVAFQALGHCGVIAVIIAGWTTSNPTIYRAGLAFHSLHPRWRRKGVTLITGIATSVIACFPFVFTQLINFVGIMGIILAPVGAIIVTEHWVFPKFNLTRYWCSYRQKMFNLPALFSWGGSLLCALVLHRAGLHLFYLLLPSWFTAMFLYLALAAKAATGGDVVSMALDYEAQQRRRKSREQRFLAAPKVDRSQSSMASKHKYIYFSVCGISLLLCLYVGFQAYQYGMGENLKLWLLIFSSCYFTAAVAWLINRSSETSAAA